MHILEMYQVSIGRSNQEAFTKLQQVKQKFVRAAGGLTISRSFYDGLYVDSHGDVVKDKLLITEVIFDDAVQPKIYELIDEWAALNFAAGQESVLYKLNGQPFFKYAADYKPETPADDESETPLFSPWPRPDIDRGNGSGGFPPNS